MIAPGCAFAYAITPASVFPGTAGWAMMSAGPDATSEIALKSLSMSNGSLESAALLACEENAISSV